MFLNEDFIDQIESDDLTGELAQEDAHINGDCSFGFGIEYLLFQKDMAEHLLTDFTKPERQSYNIYRIYQKIKRVVSAMNIVGNFELVCSAYAYYSQNYEQKETEVATFTPTPDMPHMWLYVDTGELTRLYGSYALAVSIRCNYVPQKTSFRRFITDMHMLQELNTWINGDLKYAGKSNVMMFAPGSGWYQLTHFDGYKEIYGQFYKALFGVDTEEGITVADTVYNEDAIKTLVKKFWENNRDMVNSWEVRRMFYNPYNYNSNASYTIYARDVILIDLDCKVAQPDELKTCFYTRILEALKTELFSYIPKNMRYEFEFCVRIASKDKYLIPMYARPTDTEPIHGYADGYKYVVNQGGSNFRSIMEYDDYINRSGNMKCVVLFENANGKLNHRGRIHFPKNYKWLQMFVDEKD